MDSHSMYTSRTTFERLIRKLGADKHLRRVDVVGYVSLDLESAVEDKPYMIYPLKGQPIYFGNKAQLGLRLLKLLEPEELDELASRI